MRCSVLTAALLLGSALAVPHSKHRHCRRQDGKCHRFSLGTALPAATGNGYTNSSSASPTGKYVLKHFDNDDHGTAAHPLETSPKEIQPLAADKHADQSGEQAQQCQYGTITVTSQTTYTITITPDVAPASSSAAEPVAEASENSEPSVEASPTSLAELTPSSSAETKPEVLSSSVEAKETSKAPILAPVPMKKPDAVKSLPAPKPSTGNLSPADDKTNDAPSSSAAAPASPSPKTETETAPKSSGGLPFKTKRGIWASGPTQNEIAASLGVGKISWLGDWYSGAPEKIVSSLTFVPQCYAADSDKKGEWTTNAKKAVGEGLKYMLSYGEPANPKNGMTPQEAVELWKKQMAGYADQGIKVSAPTTLQPEHDYEWLSDFLDACTGCDIGFLAMHYFNKAGAGWGELKSSLEKARTLGQKHGIQDIWLDNFNFDGSEEDQRSLLAEVVPWLEEQDWIKAYAYVNGEVGTPNKGLTNMVDGSGKINDFGTFYANL